MCLYRGVTRIVSHPKRQLPHHPESGSHGEVISPASCGGREGAQKDLQSWRDKVTVRKCGPELGVWSWQPESKGASLINPEGSAFWDTEQA